MMINILSNINMQTEVILIFILFVLVILMHILTCVTSTDMYIDGMYVFTSVIVLILLIELIISPRGGTTINILLTLAIFMIAIVIGMSGRLYYCSY